MNHMRFTHIGEEGTEVQAEYFGVVDKVKFHKEAEDYLVALSNNPERQNEYRRAINDLKDYGSFYCGWWEALRMAKRCNEGMDPENPRAHYARELRNRVVRLIEQEYPDQKIEVFYFTAISDMKNRMGKTILMPFDFKHGIDAFFEIHIGKKKIAVTMDGTTNPNKIDFKSDILTFWPEYLDQHESPNEYDQFINIESAKVMDIVKMKMDPNYVDKYGKKS